MFCDEHGSNGTGPLLLQTSEILTDIHRSFGQYLAARAHIQAASMLARRRRNDDIDDSDQTLALRWLDLIGG